MSTKKTNPKHRNPRGCTGPKTPAGKAKMARNAVRHGAYVATSEALVFLGESPEEFAVLMSDMVAALTPVGPLEARLVARMAGIWWRMERAGRAEREGLKATLDNARYMHGETRLMYTNPLEEILPAPAPDQTEPVHTATTWQGAGEGIERLQRWESQLEKRFFRLLHELEPMQARRRGHAIPPPVTIPLPDTEG